MSKGRRKPRRKRRDRPTDRVVGVERRARLDRRSSVDRRKPDEPLEAEPSASVASGAPLDATAPPPLSHRERIRQLAQLDLDESQAEELWRNVARHRRDLYLSLDRDVGPRVALLDYIVNVRPQLLEPTIIETASLEAIKRDAIYDALTGLYNRHYFDEALRREVERCQRYQVTCSLLLLDLDEFKEINDEYGHRVGDQALKVLGGLIRRHVRAADTACRYGGDEFTVIFSDTSREEALSVSERIRADVEQSFERNAVCGQFLAVTVSGGLASIPLDADSAERLFALSDGALYEAKHLGSNQIATPPGSTPATQPKTEVNGA